MPREEKDITLGALDVSVSDHDAPAGTLRLLKDLTWRGPKQAPFLSPAELPEALTDRIDFEETAGALPNGVRAVHVQVRQRRGEFSDLSGDPDQALQRLVLVTDDKIYLVDPGQGYLIKEIYTFPAALAFSKKCQFAQQGDVTYMALSTGAAAGDPAPVLVLIDDKVFPYDLPDVPFCTVTALGGGDMDAGTYAVRFVWLMKDGTLARPTRPYFVDVTANDKLEFEIAGYKTALDADLAKLIAGVQCLLTQKATGANELRDELMNMPYYRVALIASTDVGANVEFSDVNDNLVGYPLFDDQTLTAHVNAAAAAISYNRRLLLGDVAVDFAQPDPLGNLVGGTVGASSNQAPTWTASDGNPSLVLCGVDPPIYFTIEDPDVDDIGTVNIVQRFPLPLSLFEWEVWNGASWVFSGVGDVNVATGFTKKRLKMTIPACSFPLDDGSTFGAFSGKTYDLVVRGEDEEGEVAQVGFQIVNIGS